ncbi:unnamed protein product [Arctia plantaginis]|uniref:EGF-like domain-containing protein n=1 Tax=Arctia plantaginis TaxID=874455 RepID=A0A8S1AH69_ARCPL|nr:unnamed protein product [Arctia plantaginis]
MLRLLFVLVFVTFVFFITPSEGSTESSSYSTAWATTTAETGFHHSFSTTPKHVCGSHEIYSTCINSNCEPRTCAELDSPIAFCPKLDEAHCVKGCTCVPGYVRDENNVCIPKNNCYPICGKNEIYSTCSNIGCGPKTCDEQGYKIGCVKMDRKYCRGGCICKDGYLKDQNGECIPKSMCPECGGDPNAISCDNEDTCKCRDGFIYDETIGKCVVPEECQPHCPVGEIYEECPDNSCTPQTCSQLGFAMQCPVSLGASGSKCLGKPRCICANGNVRDHNGKCIPPHQCPSCGGDPNATPGCGVNCGKKCSDYKKKNPMCLLICYVNSCDCKKGYVYDDNLNKCVLPSQCTPSCGVNEVYDTCANGKCRKWKCSQPPLCKDPEKCEGGCVCRDKYTRADNGTCIPENQCKPQCPAGEIYEKCPDSSCKPLTCSQLGFPMQCTASLEASGSKCLGKPRCICANGNVRDDNGKCIPKQQCPPTCGLNEVFDTCANRGCRRWNCSQSKVCKYPKRCEAGCSCRDGYSRNENGVCIPEKQCPGLCSKPHEYYDDCPQTCLPQTCENIGKVHSCPAKLKTSKCKGKCMCEKGYYRNLIGECISEEDCKKCRGPHEYFSCGGFCDNVCATLHKYNQTTCPFINITCNRKCYCERGYARNKKNICIPIQKCPEQQCGPNERYEECPGALCSPQKCSQIGFPIYCKTSRSVATPHSACPGKPGCVCDNGYVRDKNGECIPPEKCPSCGGDPNAVIGCGNHCGRRCSDHKDNNRVCPLYCMFNSCMCRDGFVYDDNLKKCVRPKDCTPTCGINEVYDTCANSGCRRWNCSKSILCIDPMKCKAGCSCKKGFSRDRNGTCIPEDKCPEPKCGPNERYEQCPDVLCFPQKCSQLGFPIDCKTSTSLAAPNSSCPGKPGCVCDNGYVRDRTGKCIPPEKCPSCGGDPNAVTGCGNHCGRRCSDHKHKNRMCPLYCIFNSCMCRDGFVYDDNLGKCVRPKDCTPTCGINEVYDTCANSGCRRWNCSESILCIDHMKCTAGCSCKKGFSRDRNGTCIPEDKCPEPKCGPNERYEQCPNTLCSPQNCSQVGFPIDCETSTSLAALNSSCQGKPGCVCDKDYVRDKNGKCIPPEECPSCGGDPNAVKGCGVNCGRLCSNYDKGPVPCIKICKVNSCDCKHGFVLDENTRKCVNPKDCTPTCGKNEVYSKCINGGCEPKNCSQFGKQVPCVKMKPEKCVKGCLCKEKYLRASNGTCIPEDQCIKRCTKPHEYYERCVRSCSPQTCDSIGRRYYCPRQRKPCRGACRCEKGYYRNKIGECISAKDCKKCTGPHEYFSCGKECDNVCATLHKQNQTHCPFINKTCKRKCYCEKGYARNDKNICVPIEQCQEPVCGENEKYEDNPSLLGGPFKCSDLGRPLNDTSVKNHNHNYKPACICKEGYLRDDHGLCVPKSQCPPVCGKNEKYEDNPSILYGPLKCSDLGRPVDDTSVKKHNHNYKPACICKEDYLRDDHGLCVPKSQCPPCD